MALETAGPSGTALQLLIEVREKREIYQQDSATGLQGIPFPGFAVSLKTWVHQIFSATLTIAPTSDTVFFSIFS